MDDRALINKRFSTVKGDILLFKCRWRHCWRAATCSQLTKNIYQLDKYFYWSVNISPCCAFWCKHRNPKTNSSKLITCKLCAIFFLEHPVYRACWYCLSVWISVGQFSCRLANNPCTYSNIQTYGYTFPHYDPTKYIQCGVWDRFSYYSRCQEFSCPIGMLWDQTNGYCNFPESIGLSTCRLLCLLPTKKVPWL